MTKASRAHTRKSLTKSDWETLISRLHGCTNLNQLKAWSAHAAEFSMPDQKRNELLGMFNIHKESLSRKVEVA
jgi:hypothetical protein